MYSSDPTPIHTLGTGNHHFPRARARELLRRPGAGQRAGDGRLRERISDGHHGDGLEGTDIQPNPTGVWIRRVDAEMRRRVSRWCRHSSDLIGR